ncbi:MAG TPA: DNA-binding response regulator, partial [Coriobacteriia bacterium]|nr:DNA-binding response regulator [Coriobacteriia bacterium]
MTDVLIVEDNAEIAGLLRDFIRRAGYSCEVTVTGEEALRFAREHEVGIVLLDIMLPGMDGFAVCDAIHKAQNTPIIVLSARVAKDDKLNALTLGADDYIEKPYDMDL